MRVSTSILGSTRPGPAPALVPTPRSSPAPPARPPAPPAGPPGRGLPRGAPHRRVALPPVPSPLSPAVFGSETYRKPSRGWWALSATRGRGDLEGRPGTQPALGPRRGRCAGFSRSLQVPQSDGQVDISETTRELSLGGGGPGVHCECADGARRVASPPRPARPALPAPPPPAIHYQPPFCPSGEGWLAAPRKRPPGSLLHDN